MARSFKPMLGSVLTAQSLEPTSDSVSPSLSLPFPHACSVSLSLKNKNKHQKKITGLQLFGIIYGMR